jgi:iron complex outermembrane receptor protein
MRALLLPLPALTCLVGSGAAAQPIRPDPVIAPDIVVTGERVPRALSDTPSSVVVVTDDEIEGQAGPDRVDQLLALVPNVQFGSGSQGPTIRGQDSTGVLQDLPAFLGGTRPRVTLQVDGRAVSFNEFVFGVASVWDVEQIELFRSPQTTTQGRNSIGGAIFVRTQDPTYEWEGRARAIAGNYDTRQASAVVSGPIVADQLAFRIAGDIRTSRPSSDIADRMVGADPDHDDHGLLRVKLLAEPRALPGARLEASYVHVESEMPQNERVQAPFRERRDPSPGYGIFYTNVDSLTAVLDYAPAPALASTTTLSYGDAFIERFAPPGLGQARNRVRDFSFESILRSRPDGPVSLLGGVHYLRSRLNQFIDLTAVIGNGDFADRQRSLGLFGEATWRPVPGLTLTAGLRYQSDRQDRDGFLGTPGFGFTVDYDRTFAAWLPKLSAAYEVADDLTAGILIQRAFNPGGTSINFDTGEHEAFEAETLWNYEIFVRASFAGGRGTLAANLFYNDIRDAQRPQLRAYRVPSGATAFWAEIDNAPSAESYGLEIELGWRAGSRLSVHGGLGLLETRIIETLDPLDPNRGKHFQRSPHLTASAAIDWRPLDRLRLSAQLRHNSDYFSNDANTPTLRVPGSTVLNSRAAFSAGPLTLFGYVRNVFDTFYLTSLASPLFATAGDPREFGLGIESRF